MKKGNRNKGKLEKRRNGKNGERSKQKGKKGKIREEGGREKGESKGEKGKIEKRVKSKKGEKERGKSRRETKMFLDLDPTGSCNRSVSRGEGEKGTEEE